TIDLARDGRQLVYSMFLNKANIWTAPISHSDSTAVTATPLTSGTQVIEAMAISRDGQWIAFDSNRGGNADIYKMPVAGGRVEQLTSGPEDDFVPAWSPDGKFIAYHSFRDGNRDIYVMTADGRDKQQVTFDPAEERYPDWSADGQNLVFYSDKTGNSQ